MNKFLSIFLFFLLVSCSSLQQNLYNEYIEFNHKNYMVIKDDQINIKLIPTDLKRDKNVKIIITYHGKKLKKYAITKADYDEIENIIRNIDRNDLVTPRIVNKGKSDEHLVGVLDGGQNSIKVYENGNETKYSTTGFNQEFHKTFYFAVEKIFKTLNIELKNL